MSELLEGEWQGRALLEEPEYSSSQWYFPRDFIERESPSRLDGIDAAKESYLRKSYCTFLQDLGMHLKVPQVTIATAIVFCHRFFLRQSHGRNDRFVIATVCMFLAGKVEETPKLLQNVICVAHEIRHKKDPDMVQRIKNKEVYDQEKELVLLGERLVLATLGFDLNVHHPYKPLVTAIKKLRVAQNSLAQVAWNFVNDGLRTSLCLQFKAHHIAAGAIFLAAKFLKVKLPSNDKKPWWQEFDVSPRQLEEVSNQMLELYEQHRQLPASRTAESCGMRADSSTIRATAIPPGTPQVVEKRPLVDTKPRTILELSEHMHHQDNAKVSDLGQQEHIDRLKTAAEKRRKFKAEGGGGMRSKLELTAEEELLERGVEAGNKGVHADSVALGLGHDRDFSHRHHAHLQGGEPKYAVKAHLSKQGQGLEGDSMIESLENNHRYLHSRDHPPHASQNPHRPEGESDYHRRSKAKDWQEREVKRFRYEHMT